MQNKKSIGPVVGLIIILALILIGGIYFWQQRESQLKQVPTTESASTTENAGNQSVSSATSSDDIDSISKDLQNTDIDGLSTETGAGVKVSQ